MNVCFADLHVHTALSPCAAEEMTPPAIVARALAEGLEMIAVCDHNSAANAAAVQAAAGARLTVLAGMEVTSAEAHLLMPQISFQISQVNYSTFDDVPDQR